MTSKLHENDISNGLNNVNQSGYKHLTETVSLSIKTEVHLVLTRGEATAVVFLDQSAMTDTIDNSMFIDCLSSWFGVGVVVLYWFKFTSLTTISALTLALFYPTPKNVALYTTPLSKVIISLLSMHINMNYPNICFHFYPDSMQFYDHLTQKNVTQVFDRLKTT